MMIKTRRENASGLFFWTRHQVTANYQVIEQRQCGSEKVTYLLSTGKDVKAAFSDMFAAFCEAKRRQAWIDAR